MDPIPWTRFHGPDNDGRMHGMPLLQLRKNANIGVAQLWTGISQKERLIGLRRVLSTIRTVYRMWKEKKEEARAGSLEATDLVS